jgi:hypothetical protein
MVTRQICRGMGTGVRCGKMNECNAQGGVDSYGEWPLQREHQVSHDLETAEQCARRILRFAYVLI